MGLDKKKKTDDNHDRYGFVFEHFRVLWLIFLLAIFSAGLLWVYRSLKPTLFVIGYFGFLFFLTVALSYRLFVLYRNEIQREKFEKYQAKKLVEQFKELEKEKRNKGDL